MLATFDAEVTRGNQTLTEVTDEMLWQNWRLKIMGQERFEKTQWDVFRDFTLNHLVHHRGQLSVYLRLLDVPVLGANGPTADEQNG